jgi:hypothetical protein
MLGYRGVYQIASQTSKPRQGAVLILAGHAAEADHVGCQDRRDLPGFGHGAPHAHTHNSTEREARALGADVGLGAEFLQVIASRAFRSASDPDPVRSD